jgi:hypothetical protein
MKETIFTAPIDGYYQVSGKIYNSKPTGKMVQIKNPARHWYTFWLPKTIMEPEYEMTEGYTGHEIQFMRAGETAIGPGNRV